MKNRLFSPDKLWIKTLITVLFGFLAGGINGLLGAGGGILTVYALNFALKGEEADRRDIYANALCVMLPISAVSCVRYAAAGNIHTEGFAVYALPAILGGLLGGFLLGRLKPNITKKLFGILVVWSGIMLIIR